MNNNLLSLLLLSSASLPLIRGEHTHPRTMTRGAAPSSNSTTNDAPSLADFISQFDPTIPKAPTTTDQNSANSMSNMNQNGSNAMYNTDQNMQNGIYNMNQNDSNMMNNMNQNMPNASGNIPETVTTTPSGITIIRPIQNEALNQLLPTGLKPRFSLPPLGYDYDALEPYIDEDTMRIHHDRLHQGYVNRLNSALSRYPELYAYNLGELLANSEKLPSDIKASVINDGGGHFNHTFFWNMMSPNGGGNPTGALGEAINAQFGSYDNFKRAFRNAALSVFGSGWAWLVLTPSGRLEILTTSNQNTPIPLRVIPILALDVWEHAYFLDYENNRENYINQWFNVINWNYANAIYEASLQAINPQNNMNNTMNNNMMDSNNANMNNTMNNNMNTNNNMDYNNTNSNMNYNNNMNYGNTNMNNNMNYNNTMDYNNTNANNMMNTNNMNYNYTNGN